MGEISKDTLQKLKNIEDLVENLGGFIFIHNIKYGKKLTWMNSELTPVSISGTNYQAIIYLRSNQIDSNIVTKWLLKINNQLKIVSEVIEHSTPLYSIFYKDVYIGSLGEYFSFYLYGVKKFYAYSDFSSSKSNEVCVGQINKNNFCGFSHRGIAKFAVGDVIDYNSDLLILSHGYVKGSPEYDKEEKEIEKVRKMFKNGNLVIKTPEQAKFLAWRFASSIA